MSRPYPLYKIKRSWCQCKKVLLGVRGVKGGRKGVREITSGNEKESNQRLVKFSVLSHSNRFYQNKYNKIKSQNLAEYSVEDQPSLGL